MIHVTLTGNADALAVLDRVAGALRPEVLGAGMEMAAESVIKDHLLVHYVPRVNKLGGVSTGYWGKVMESVTAEARGADVTVSITHIGAALHYYGGVVRPTGRISTITGRPIRFLTIPVHAAAHAKTASDFGGRLYSDDGGLKFQQGAEKSDGDPMYFRFARSATFAPDPEMLPEVATMHEAARAALVATVEAAAAGEIPGAFYLA